MAKERNFNPAQAQHKADKAKAIKKGKAEVQAQRSEKLARRNPDRLQKQVDDLKAVVSNGGKLSRHEEQDLERLEKELRAVQKARDALGDKAPTFGRGGDGGSGGGNGGGRGVLGKRRRGNDHDMDDSTDAEEIPDEVRSIPMPRDTPPPVPKEVLDRWWARRRTRWARENRETVDIRGSMQGGGGKDAGKEGNSGNGLRDGTSKRSTSALSAPPPPRPPVVSKTVYGASPVVRDLRKEAVAFVPASVRAKMLRDKGRNLPAQSGGDTGVPEKEEGQLEAVTGPGSATVEDAVEEEG